MMKQRVSSSVTFTFPYTERSLVLILGEEICDMAMDFENAVLLSADMSALKNLLEEANEKLENKDKYTVNTVETLEIEIRKAETLLTDLDAEQVAVDSQVNLLRQSIDGLKEKASDDQLTELSQLKREIAAAINDETYTSASRAELKELYDELTESTADTDNISTEDYEQYVLSIEAAMAARRKRPTTRMMIRTIVPIIKCFLWWRITVPGWMSLTLQLTVGLRFQKYWMRRRLFPKTS